VCGDDSSPNSLSHLLQLREVLVNPARNTRIEPLVDYTKSIIITRDDYIKAMEEKATCKESMEKEKEQRKIEAELSKGRRAQDKLQKEVAKLQRLVDAGARHAFAEKWFAKVVARAGEDLDQLIKSGAPPPPGAYIGRFVTFCPEICRKNQAIVKERMRVKREGRTPNSTLITIPPLWIHLHDTYFLIEVDRDYASQVI
jgi:hypothetical protein